MTKKFEIEFIYHGIPHYLIDSTSGNAKKAVQAIKRDFDRCKIIKVKQL